MMHEEQPRFQTEPIALCFPRTRVPLLRLVVSILARCGRFITPSGASSGTKEITRSPGV